MIFNKDWIKPGQPRKISYGALKRIVHLLITNRHHMLFLLQDVRLKTSSFELDYEAASSKWIKWRTWDTFDLSGIIWVPFERAFKWDRSEIVPYFEAEAKFLIGQTLSREHSDMFMYAVQAVAIRLVSVLWRIALRIKKSVFQCPALSSSYLFNFHFWRFWFWYVKSLENSFKSRIYLILTTD